MRDFLILLAFESIRQSMAQFLQVILGIAAVVLLGVSTIHIINGDKEGGKKFIRWLAGVVFGFIIITVIGYKI